MLNVIFIEKPIHVEYFLKHKAEFAGDYLLISLTPHVSYYMEKQGVSYNHCDCYYTHKELNDHFIEDLKRVDALCKFIDVEVKRSIPYFKEHSIEAGTISWYSLKLMVNSFSWNVFVINRIFSNEKPSKVFFFKDTREMTYNPFAPVPENISLWSVLIPLVADGVNVPASEITVMEGSHRDSTIVRVNVRKFFMNLKPMAKNSVKTLIAPSLIMMLRHGFNEYLQNFKSTRKAPLIVFLYLNYQLKHLWDFEISDNVFRIVCYKQWRDSNSGDMDELIIEMADRLIKNKELKNVFTEGNTKYFSALRHCLHYFFTKYLTEIWQNHKTGRAFFEKTEPKAVLTSTTVDHKTRAIIEAARSLKIPIVVYRHGFTNGHVSMESYLAHPIRYTDVEAADYFLVGGQGDVDLVNKHASGETKTVAVGLLTLESTKRKYITDIANGKREKICSQMLVDYRKRIFMYVPTSWDGNIKAGPFRNRQPEFMFEIERKIVDMFMRHPDHCLIMKLFPLNQYLPVSPITDYIEDRQPENIRISFDLFEDVMVAADVFITDLSPTSLFQMLLTEKPIFFCGDELPYQFNREKWYPDILPMWRNRIFYKDNINEFIKMLEEFIEHGDFEKKWTDREMLEQFGLYQGGEGITEKCHEILLKIGMKEEPTS